MIYALSKDPMQMFSGMRYVHSMDEQGDYFEYEYPDNQKTSHRAATAGRNLVTNDETTRIKTNWALNFRVGEYVTLADDNTYYIDSVTKEISSTAYQVLAVNTRPEYDTILSLRLARNTKGGAM